MARVGGSTKRLASRFYQLKTGHCLIGQYLNWTKNRPIPQCWWCQYREQTRDHLFKERPEWKPQQKILWAEVFKETKEMEEPVEGPRRAGRREVQPAGTRLPHRHRRGKESAG